MRRLILTLAVFAALLLPATAEEKAPDVAEIVQSDVPLPEHLTPHTLDKIADNLETLSHQMLVREPGGRKFAAARRAESDKKLRMAKKLRTAAKDLQAAQSEHANSSAELAAAEAHAISITQYIADNLGEQAVSDQLQYLLAGPPPTPPEPVTYVFCMEAVGPGPVTFTNYAPDALTETIPYVQGYITHVITQTSSKKLRLELTVEHDAKAAPFAAIDALQNANKAAFAKMSDEVKARTRASETILMGDLADRLCSTSS